MFKDNILEQILCTNLFTGLPLTGCLAFSIGCVSSDKKPENSYSSLKYDLSITRKEGENNHLKDQTDFFIVAKLKSVNDQPKEFLEFKKRRFEKKVQCMQWMSDHRQFIEHTLNRHIAAQKKGYFVDSIECLKISYFFKKSHNREYEV